MMHIVEDKNGNLRSDMTANELREYMHNTNGSFYDQLKACASDMTSRQISMEDRENQRFRIINVVQTAEYSNGVFTVKYNSDMKKYLYNIQENFTILNIDILVNFKSVYSFRLYELLKSKAYYPKSINQVQRDKCFKISYTVAELKLDLGVVNSNLDRVQKSLTGKAPDFDKAVDLAKEKTFNRWSDFRTRVLDVAINEINSKPEIKMNVSYDVGKKGKGGKVHEVYFVVQLLSDQMPNIIVDESTEDIMEQLDELFANENIRYKDIKAIAQAADNKFGKVKKAYDIYLEQNTTAKNFVGWIINAIQNDYHEPIPGTNSKPNNFNQFTQNEYDYDKLEKELLAN